MRNISAPDNNKIIYLDNAATSWPKPESVYRAIDDFLRNVGGNPGRGSHSLAVAAADVVNETRMLIAQLINAPEIARVVFTFNCTDALNMGLKGLLKPGDHVITDCISHNSIVRPLTTLEQQGVKVTRIKSSPETGWVSPADIEAAIIRDTRLLVITHASNVNGVIQPVAEYGKLARHHRLIFMVDAAQTAGICPLDVQSYYIDLLAFSGHKGLFGPPGTGVLYIGERAELAPLREGGTGSYSEQEKQPEVLPDKYESGTLNGVGLSGLGAGIKFILNEGMGKILRHEQSLIVRLLNGLSQIPVVNLYTAEDPSQQAPVIACNISGYEPGEVGAILDQAFNIKVRTGLHCAPLAHKTLGTFPSGTIRLSPGYFNTDEDINRTIAAFSKIAATAQSV